MMRQTKTFNKLLAAEQLAYLVKQAPSGFAATVAVLVFIISEVHNFVDQKWLIVWASAIALLNIYLLIWTLLARRAQHDTSPTLFIRLYQLQALLHGLCWGMLPFLMLGTDTNLQYFAFIILCGMAAGAIGTTAVIYQIYMTFLLTTMLPMLLGQIFLGDSLHLFGDNAIPPLVIFIIALGVLGHNYYLRLKKSISLVLENQQLLETTNMALAHAESASHAKSSFLANMSHELRTPLNAVIGYSELIHENAKEKIFDNIEKDAAKINQSGKHLLSLINAVLDVSKIESGKMEVFAEQLDIANLIEEITTTSQALVEKNFNQLKIEVDSNIGHITSDHTKLCQILLNIISNAAKFTKEGQITLHAQGGEQQITIQISDTGIGMNEEALEKLTDAFVQADASTTRKYGGTGLGMHLTKHLCDMLGINLKVKSTPGQGTTFTLTIPRSYQPNSEH